MLLWSQEHKTIDRAHQYVRIHICKSTHSSYQQRGTDGENNFEEACFSLLTTYVLQKDYLHNFITSMLYTKQPKFKTITIRINEQWVTMLLFMF